MLTVRKGYSAPSHITSLSFVLAEWSTMIQLQSGSDLFLSTRGLAVRKCLSVGRVACTRSRQVGSRHHHTSVLVVAAAKKKKNKKKKASAGNYTLFS